MTVAASRIVLVVLRIIFAPLGIAAPHRPAIGEYRHCCVARPLTSHDLQRSVYSRKGARPASRARPTSSSANAAESFRPNIRLPPAGILSFSQRGHLAPSSSIRWANASHSRSSLFGGFFASSTVRTARVVAAASIKYKVAAIRPQTHVLASGRRMDTSDLKVRNRGTPQVGARIGRFRELRFEGLGGPGRCVNSEPGP